MHKKILEKMHDKKMHKTSMKIANI